MGATSPVRPYTLLNMQADRRKQQHIMWLQLQYRHAVHITFETQHKQVLNVILCVKKNWKLSQLASRSMHGCGAGIPQGRCNARDTASRCVGGACQAQGTLTQLSNESESIRASSRLATPAGVPHRDRDGAHQRQRCGTARRAGPRDGHCPMYRNERTHMNGQCARPAPLKSGRRSDSARSADRRKGELSSRQRGRCASPSPPLAATQCPAPPGGQRMARQAPGDGSVGCRLGCASSPPKTGLAERPAC